MLLDDVAKLLQDNGVGVIDKTIFKGYFPDQRTNCIAVAEYAGQPPELSGGVYLEHPGIQVKVRDKSYSLARARCKVVQDILNNVANQAVGDSYFTYIRANQSPTPNGRTLNEEFEFVQNFSVGLIS